MKLNRRDLLKCSILAGGFQICGFEKIAGLQLPSRTSQDPVGRGKQLGTVSFEGEGWLPMDRALGAELDGRLYTDLSGMTSNNPITPTEQFFIRTSSSEFLDAQEPWSIEIHGPIQRPLSLDLEKLAKMAKSLGLHLIECAGNSAQGHFGMLSVAEWMGTPLSEIFALSGIKSREARVLISGFDRYLKRSRTSIPGASWIFTVDELESSHAFLATGMNGQPLPRDHGAPVRLVVPGWYGCAAIKWVNEIVFVPDDVEATSQMREYAARTLQSGVPALAREYHPATIDQAAMPIRIEKWLVDGRIRYRLVGILWGGSRPVNILEIQFNPEEPYAAVDSFEQRGNDPWSFWTHLWTPKKPGSYKVQLRVKDPPVSARRMDAGYYVRSVQIAEV